MKCPCQACGERIPFFRVKNILLAILPLALLMVACGKQQAIINVHNQLVAIESTMVNSYNAANSAAGQASAVNTAVAAIQRIDVSECPPDYQAGWREVLQTWKEWETALSAGDIPLADKFASDSPMKTQALNAIAKSHGVQIHD